MTCVKSIITSLQDGIDVRVGYDEENSTDEEKRLAIEMSFVLNEYLHLKGAEGRIVK